MFKSALIFFVSFCFALWGCGQRQNSGIKEKLGELQKNGMPKTVLRIDLKKILPNLSEQELLDNQDNYLPLFFQLKGDTLLLSNKALNKIDFLNLRGEFLGSASYDGFGTIDVVKFQYANGLLYLLDPYRGLFVVDASKKGLLHRDERTVNMFATSTGNIYFQNSLGRKPHTLEVLPANSAFFDKAGILKSPLQKDFYSVFVNDTTMTGIKFSGEYGFDSPFQIETLRLRDLVVTNKASIDSVCSSCFYFPRMLTEKAIIASNTRTGMNYLFELSSDGRLRQHEVAPPERFKPMVGFEYTPFHNLGFNFEYNAKTNELLCAAMSEKEILIFKYDMRELLSGAAPR